MKKRSRLATRRCDAILDDLVARGRQELPRTRELRGLRRRVLAAIAGGLATGSATAATGTAAALWVKVATGAIVVAVGTTAGVALPEVIERTSRESAAVSTAGERGPRRDVAVEPPIAPVYVPESLGEEAPTPEPVPTEALAQPQVERAVETRGASRPPQPSPLVTTTEDPTDLGTPSPRARIALGVSLLREARGAVDAEPSRALALIDRHAAEFPDVLDQERELIAIEALRGAGRAAEARERASRFLALYPESTYRHRIAALVR
jgi:hypothetical protein